MNADQQKPEYPGPDYYRTLFESSGEALFVIRDGLVIDCNRRSAALLGVSSPRDLIGRSAARLAALFANRSARAGEKCLARLEAAQRGEPQRFECRVSRPDGARPYLEVFLNPLTLAGGEAVLASVRDVTERAHENRLLETLVTLTSLQDVPWTRIMDYALESALGITGSPIGYIFYYDEEARRFALYSWSKSAMAQCTVADKQVEYPLDNCGLWGEAVRQRKAVITNDYAADNPLKKGTPEGHVPLTRHLNLPVFEGGKIVLVAGVGNKATPYTEADARNLASLMNEAWKISRRGEMENALRESEEHFRRLVKQSPIPMAITDDHERFEFLNDQFINDFGYTLEDLPDLEAWWKLAYPDEERRREARADWQRAMTTSTWQGLNQSLREYHLTGRDGRIRISEIRANKIGRKYLYQFTDLTERARAEEDLSRMRVQFMQAQKMEAVGRLAGGVAHDFNNLLTSIMGYSELIRLERDLAPQVREGIEEIEKAAQRAGDLTRQLLAFGRKQILQPRVIDLNALVQNVERMLERLIREDISLVSCLADGEMKVLADPGQIEQVIINLAVNARDAMPWGGTLTISTDRVTVTQGPQVGDFVLLSVSDTGEGMSAAVRAHLFEPFFTTKEPGKGTGLGLSTVYGIVSQSGGFIEVDSEHGQGTRFRVYLPCAAERSAEAPRRETEPQPQQGAETILLVEDDEALLEMTARMLGRYGYAVVMEHDPAEALEHLALPGRRPPDLIITDVVMPRMSGRELADRAALLHPGVRILFVSGYTDDAILRHGVLDAGLDFLQKPYTPQALAARVRKILDRRAPPDAPGPPAGSRPDDSAPPPEPRSDRG